MLSDDELDSYFIIVPIMDVGQVQDWTGKEHEELSYDALVLVGKCEDGSDCRDEVARSTPCSETEAEKAIELLAAYTKALSFSLQTSDFTELPNLAPKMIKAEVRKNQAALEETKEKIKQKGTPILRLLECAGGELKLVKVKFRCTGRPPRTQYRIHFCLLSKLL